MSAVAAARLGDEVAHGFGMLAMVAGAVVGAVVGAAIVGATVATGGVAVAIIAGSVAAGGMSLGQLVKGLTKKFNLPEPASGVLMLGSGNVRFNSRAAMRANLDIAACSGLPFNHPGQPAVPIAQGSSTVRINGMPAARLNDKLMCGAHIKSGSPNIFIGGPTAQVRNIYDTEEWAEYSLTALGIFAIGAGGGAAFAAGGLAGLAMFAGVTGGVMVGFEGIGRLGDRLGPGGRDILQGAAGLLLLGLGPKLARMSRANAPLESTNKEPPKKIVATAKARPIKYEEITAPNGKKIKCAVDGRAIVPVDKVAAYARGNVVDSRSQLRELQNLKQTSRKIFDADPNNNLLLKRLKDQKHNFERATEMAKNLNKIGLPNTEESNNRIINHLLDAGQKASKENRLDLPSILHGENGSLKVLSTWTIIDDGRAYLSTLKLIPIGD